MDDDNGFARDAAKCESNIPRVTPDGVLTNDTSFGWANGHILWNVPSGWGDRGMKEYEEPHKIFAADITHLLSISTNGQCSIEKFEHTVVRRINDDVFLDGIYVSAEDE